MLARRKLSVQKGRAMINKDLLETLKKHIQDIDGAGFEISSEVNQKISKFGEDIKNTNEFIGALQIVSVTLKKCIDRARLIEGEFQGQSQEEKNEYASLKIREMMSKCSFMGTALFDATFGIEFDGRWLEFSISTPESFLVNYDFESVIAYFEDKQEEIKENLALISGKFTAEVKKTNSMDSSYSQQSFAQSKPIKL